MKRLPVLIILIAMLAALSNTLWAEESAPAQPTMQARFLENKAVLGQPATLSLEFTLPQGAKLTDPVELNGLDDIPILNKKRTDKGLDISLLVNSLNTFKVPSTSLAFLSKEGTKEWLDFPTLEIPVDNGLPDDPSKMQPRPIKGLMPGKSFLMQYAPWAGGAVLLILACLGLWFFIKNRKAKAVAVPPIPPHIIAMDGLNRLQSWWEYQGEDKEGYFRLSSIIRTYMGGIRPFPAADLTILEIRSRMQEKEDREILPVLEEADMIKFAGARVAEATRKEHLAMAWDYVKKTMPVEEEIQEVQAEVVE